MLTDLDLFALGLTLSLYGFIFGFGMVLFILRFFDKNLED